ncbi:MAG: hypothetical protein ABSG67_13370 [Thermoguttaceae bacterium]
MPSLEWTLDPIQSHLARAAPCKAWSLPVRFPRSHAPALGTQLPYHQLFTTYYLLRTQRVAQVLEPGRLCRKRSLSQYLHSARKTLLDESGRIVHGRVRAPCEAWSRSMAALVGMLVWSWHLMTFYFYTLH